MIRSITFATSGNLAFMIQANEELAKMQVAQNRMMNTDTVMSQAIKDATSSPRYIGCAAVPCNLTIRRRPITDSKVPAVRTVHGTQSKK